MTRYILPAILAFGLAACGNDGAGEEAQRNSIGEAIDEKALVEAVNSSIDRNAVEGLAREAISSAVQEAIPAEIRAAGMVVDEKALAKGIDQAIDVKTLRSAVENAAVAVGKSLAEVSGSSRPVSTSEQPAPRPRRAP